MVMPEGRRHPSMLDGMAAITVGAPDTRTFAVNFPISHHRQWGGVSFKISGEER
jgi:hypothetical protein